MVETWTVAVGTAPWPANTPPPGASADACAPLPAIGSLPSSLNQVWTPMSPPVTFVCAPMYARKLGFMIALANVVPMATKPMDEPMAFAVTSPEPWARTSTGPVTDTVSLWPMSANTSVVRRESARLISPARRPPAPAVVCVFSVLVSTAFTVTAKPPSTDAFSCAWTCPPTAVFPSAPASPARPATAMPIAVASALLFAAAQTSADPCTVVAGVGATSAVTPM